VLDANLRVRKANPAFYRIFGGEEAQTENRLISELGEGRWDIPRLRTLLENALQSGTTSEGFEDENIFPGPGRKVLLLDARALRDESMSMILVTAEDVTERVQAREELKRLNRELEHRIADRTAELEASNRELAASNRELEAFCYSVSHDLRSPLRAMDGFSSELLRSYSGQVLDEKGQHYLQRIRAGTQRMGQLIDDLLQLSRISRGELRRERVDLTTTAVAFADELRQRDPDRKVSFEIAPGLTGQGDPGLLKVALENLLENAWKFTSKKPGATITVGQVNQEGRPAFFVKDDGAGFDMTYADKLFRAFQRLHSEREFPGNGIGLATVQRAIRRQGGQVWAEGRPGEGATFFFTLPSEQHA
jgi:PAS domain S-box-containing protein